MKKKITTALILLITITLVIGCLQEPRENNQQKIDTNDSFTVTDDYGREIEVPTDVQRIVSTAPSNTEIIYSINASDKLVGVTDYCDYPPSAKNKSKVGGFQDPNTEKIVLLNPDVVIASSQTGKQVSQQLDKLNIPVIVIDPSNITEIMEGIELTGKIANREKEATSLVNELENKIQEVKDRTSDLEEKKTLFIVSGSGGNYWVAGENTFINELIEKSNGENVAKDVEGFKKVGLESIQEWNPETIIYPINSGINETKLYNNSQWEGIEAIEQENLRMIKNQDPVTRPGPRIAKGLELIAQEIHPTLNLLFSTIKSGGAISA